MASAEELYEKWKKQCPKQGVKTADFLKVMRHYLPPHCIREHEGGSHRFMIKHPALMSQSSFSGYAIFSVPVKSGNYVKEKYVSNLLKAIKVINESEGEWSEDK